MGLFSTRPEEPTEWAGLPSEPNEPRPAAELLGDPIGSASSLASFGSSVESVVIPVAPVAEDAPAPSGAADDPQDQHARQR